MACIVYQIDKKTGVKYAYESVSYWDKEKKQPRSRRRYLGKVDPETGEIIPSRSSAAPIKISEADASEIIRLRTALEERDARIAELKDQLEQKTEEVRVLRTCLEDIAKNAGDERITADPAIEESKSTLRESDEAETTREGSAESRQTDLG